MGDSGTWCERSVDEAQVAALTAAGFPPLVARLLSLRGVTPQNAAAFFDPALARLVDPLTLPGIPEAARVILAAVRARKRIVVFGDYDVDGVCASSILVSTIRRLDAAGATKVDAFIPLRLAEGYGMTAKSLERLRREYPDVALVVTVDNGITSPNEVAGLRRDGIAVVVTDHHLPGERLPEAEALVDPRVAAVPGCENLCGAGVAFFLAMALARLAAAEGLYKGPKFGGPLLVLAGFATVADLVPLTGQNRILVAQSLVNFERCAPIGLRELYAHAARSTQSIMARDYGFTLGPRINAAGRMDTARTAYDLIMCLDREAARGLVVKVGGDNANRKTNEMFMIEDAGKQVEAVREKAKTAPPEVAETLLAGFVVSDAFSTETGKWHLGVAGIVASRLVELYHVPVAVAVGDTGSVRAPDGYNVHEALKAAEAHLERFGGHAAAGGFTVKKEGFAGFRAAFKKACAEQHRQTPEAEAMPFDVWVEPQDLTLDLVTEIQRLEPFGEGNPEPVFALRNVGFCKIDPIGAGRHVVISFTNRAIPRAVWWGHGNEVEALRLKSALRFDVLFTVTKSDFGSEFEHVELRIIAIRPSQG